MMAQHSGENAPFVLNDDDKRYIDGFVTRSVLSFLIGEIAKSQGSVEEAQGFVQKLKEMMDDLTEHLARNQKPIDIAYRDEMKKLTSFIFDGISFTEK